MKKDLLINQKKYLLDCINRYNYKIPFNNFFNIKFKNKTSDSWFKIRKAKINTKINFNFDNKQYNENIVKCKKIIILPTEEQSIKLLSWFESYRKMYNKTLKMIYQLIKEKNKNCYNFQYIRTHKMKSIKETLINKSKINSHILDGAIKLATTSFKSANTNKKNGHIKNYRIRPIKQSKKSKILDLEKSYFYKDGFCKKALGKMKTNYNFNFKDIGSDSKLHYNKNTNRFTLLIPVKEKCKDTNNSDFISIEPGIKTFLTGISSTNIHQIGTNIIDTLKTDLYAIDNLNKINNKLARKKIIKKYTSIKNKITDLHWKSINYIIKKQKSKDIFIGNWSTKNISSRDNNLQPIYKRIASSLRYYDFLQKLQFKANQYNINLKITDESYTSKICSFCSTLTTISSDRKLNCKCKLNLDRDINGSINILLKSL
jgi:transposase